MSSSFVAELARKLYGQSAALAMPLNWIEQRLSELGLSIAQLVQSENQQQATDQVSISNSIASLRLLAATDWHAFVEKMSVAERTLREDPAGVYGRMDFATRDHYRHVLERFARRSGLAEDQVARSCSTPRRPRRAATATARRHVATTSSTKACRLKQHNYGFPFWFAAVRGRVVWPRPICC
jgi:hypothetical protein